MADRPFTISKVYDPRIAVERLVLGQQPNLVIEQSSSNMQFSQVNASTVGQNTISWNNVTWDPNNGLNRFMYVSVPVTFTFTGSVTAPQTTLLMPGLDAPRSHFFKCVNSSSVTINTTTLTENTSVYVDSLSWFGGRSDKINDYTLSFSHILDNDVDYIPSSNNNVLGTYANSAIYGAEGRGAYGGGAPGTGFTGQQPVLWRVASNGATGAVVHCLFNEPCYVSPFSQLDQDKPALIGIKNLIIQLAVEPNGDILWSHSASALTPTFTVTATLGDVNNYYGALPVLHYQLLTIPRSIFSDNLPPAAHQFVYDYYVTQVNTQTIGNIGITGDSQYGTVSSNAITPNSVPRYIYLWIAPQNSQIEVTQPFNYAVIESINIQFGNKQNLLSNFKNLNGLNFNPDLFKYICQKNNLNMSLNQFAGHVGSIIAIDPVEDLNLDYWNTTGETNYSTFTATISYHNQSNYQMTNAQLNIVFVNYGLLLYDGAGTFISYTNIVKPEYLAKAMILDNKDYYYDKQKIDYLGGFSAKESLKTIGRVGQKIIPGVQKAIPLLNLIPGVNTVTPYVQAALPVAKYASDQLAGLGFEDYSGVGFEDYSGIGRSRMQRGGARQPRRSLYDKFY